MVATITIACPMWHRDGWTCDGELTVRVTGRYRPAHGFDPGEFPEYEITGQTCGCDPLAIESTEGYEERIEDALAARGEEGR